MSNKSKGEGLTPSERYLGRLCRQSFLSLWSYSNLYTDRGRTNGRGGGHELCDLLVVFGDDVIIFSDKDIKFDQSKETLIAWKRWFKRAVQKSAVQLYRAERWLRTQQDRIYLDPHCKKPFPISLPTPDRIRVHRVAVAIGAYHACRDYFGGNSLGSLVVSSDLAGDEHYKSPFWVGHVNPDKGFVHVFEEYTLDRVFEELDTISDFIAYLSKRELFLARDKPKVTAAGDEQLLAIYLTKTNAEGEHDFVFPSEGEPDSVSFDESFWEGMVKKPQYIAKKKADEISYAWDKLIVRFIKYGRGYGGQTEAELEEALRHMASEPRTRRRYLAQALVNFLENTPNNKRAARLVHLRDLSKSALPEKAYLFLVLPVLEDMEYQEYRKHRRALLSAYCKVAKLLCTEANYIIGFATEGGTKGASEDLLILDVRDWTPERQEEAESFREEFSLLLENKIIKTEGRVSEWPEGVAGETVIKSSDGELNSKQRKKFKKKLIRQKRKQSKESKRKNRRQKKK